MRNYLLACLFICASVSALAQDNAGKLKQEAAAKSDKIENQCIAWRRDFHEHPELGNRETRTSAIIAAHLKKLNIETKENVAKLGPLEINKENEHPVPIGPIVGGVCIVGGIVLLVSGRRSSP